MFLLILISGEHFGGFYLLYLIMGLPFGAAHSFIALAGLTLLFLGYKLFRKRLHPLKPALYLSGDTLLIVALTTFFLKSEGYNNSTFEQVIPLFSMGLFALCLICNIILSAFLFYKFYKANGTIGITQF